MNESDLEKVHKACELIETSRTHYSCGALWIAFEGNILLCEGYCKFHGKPYASYWLSEECYHIDFYTLEKQKNLRIMLMLVWAMAPDDVREELEG